MSPDDVRVFRQDFGMSQSELAAHTGFSQAQISKIERGNATVPSKVKALIEGRRNEAVLRGKKPEIKSVDIADGTVLFGLMKKIEINIANQGTTITVPVSARVPKKLDLEDEETKQFVRMLVESVSRSVLQAGFDMGVSRVATVVSALASTLAKQAQ